MNSKNDGSKIALIIGGVLVVFGLWQLAQHVFGAFFSAFWKAIAFVMSLLGPLVVIIAGILLVIAARRDKLHLPKDKQLYRSTKDKKIAGVCGGLAEYFNLNHTLVRILVLVFAVLSAYIVIPLYILLWLIIPPDTQSFNTWI
jgi:phage shock protein PspC (stress-responsive transcriptional regulator)